MSDEIVNLYSPHAEESLVGAAIIDISVLDRVDVRSEDFYIHRNRYIWDALVDLKDSGMGADFVTLGEKLDRMGKLAEIGGPAYLVGLIGSTPSTYGAEDYAVIVRDNANRRRALQIANEIAMGAVNKDRPLDDTVSGAISSLAISATGNQRAVHWSKFLNQAYDVALERSENPGGVWGLRTGFDDYDYVSGGMQSAELVLVTGEPGVGKSMWIGQLMTNLARSAPGAVYSLEMKGESVALRSITGSAKIKTRLVKSGTAGDMWTSFAAAVEELNALEIYMSDDESWTTTLLRADLARLKREAGIKWFIIDYTYLLCDGDGKLNEIEKTQMVISNLKRICKSMDLAGIAIHSMTKAGMSGEINQAALRGSGQNIYDADVIIGLTIPDAITPNLIKVSILKGREMDSKGSFLLERMNGIPWYKPVKERTVDLDTFNAQRV